MNSDTYNAYVTLQKENEKLNEEMKSDKQAFEKLRGALVMSNASAKRRGEWLKEKESEIVRLKEERDSFAIEFAAWMTFSRYEFSHGDEETGDDLYISDTDPEINPAGKSLKDLLELYKQSLLNG